MDTLTFLLVCEGPTDIVVLKSIADKLSENMAKNIKIRELSPQKDATTQRYPRHGWEEVRRWCKIWGKTEDSNDPFAALARKKNWRALLALENASGLIIQMDTDIAEQINVNFSTYSGSSKSSRKRYCNNAILTWLGESERSEQAYFLLSTYSTETWILATKDRSLSVFDDLSDTFDFETIDNPTERLINLGYKCYTENSRIKLSKDLRLYNQYSNQISDNLSVVRQECETAEEFCSFLENS